MTKSLDLLGTDSFCETMKKINGSYKQREQSQLDLVHMIDVV